MNAQCPTCQQFLPIPDPVCECRHRRSAHSLPDNGPRGCGSAVVEPGKRARNCNCRLHQSEVAA